MDDMQGQGFHENYLPNIDDRIHRMHLRLGQTKPTSLVGKTIASKAHEQLRMQAQ